MKLYSRPTSLKNNVSGVRVTSLACTDADTEMTFSTLRYTLLSGDDVPGTEKFILDSDSGILSTHTTPLDYETRPTYELVVRVIDNPSALTHNSATATIIVMVRNIFICHVSPSFGPKKGF